MTSMFESDVYARESKVKKAKCPYCKQDLILDITAFCRWTIRANCTKCGKEIDFGFLPPLKPLAWICEECKSIFMEMAIDQRGRSISPCCGSRSWTPLYKEPIPAGGTFIL